MSDVSPLPSLPPELRNMIYEFALVEDYPIKLLDGDHIPAHGGMIAPLVEVNRQIRSEALPMYFSRNSFSVYHPTLSYGRFKGLFANHKQNILRYGLSLVLRQQVWIFDEQQMQECSFIINLQRKTVEKYTRVGYNGHGIQIIEVEMNRALSTLRWVVKYTYAESMATNPKIFAYRLREAVFMCC